MFNSVVKDPAMRKYINQAFQPTRPPTHPPAHPPTHPPTHSNSGKYMDEPFLAMKEGKEILQAMRDGGR